MKFSIGKPKLTCPQCYGDGRVPVQRLGGRGGRKGIKCPSCHGKGKLPRR